MKSPDEIRKSFVVSKERIVNSYSVTEIGISSFYAKEEMKETGDIAILIEFKKDAKVTLYLFTKEDLSISFNFRVEFIIKSS